MKKNLKKVFREVIDTLDGVFEATMDFITILLSLIIFIGLFIAFPVWGIPYGIYKVYKKKKEEEFYNKLKEM